MCTLPMYTSESPRRWEPGPREPGRWEPGCWEPGRWEPGPRELGPWDCAAACEWIRRVMPRVTVNVARNPISIHTAGARPVSTKMRWYHPTPEPYPPGLRRYRTARPGSART